MIPQAHHEGYNDCLVRVIRMKKRQEVSNQTKHFKLTFVDCYSLNQSCLFTILSEETSDANDKFTNLRYEDSRGG